MRCVAKSTAPSSLAPLALSTSPSTPNSRVAAKGTVHVLAHVPSSTCRLSYRGFHLPTGPEHPWYHPSPELLDAADAAWHAAAKVNKELEELEPVILAPTSIQPYTVASNGHNVTQTPIRESQAAKPHKSSCMHPQLALLFVVFIWV